MLDFCLKKLLVFHCRKLLVLLYRLQIYRVALHLSDESATFLFIIAITIVIKYGSYLVNKHLIKYICIILHNMIY